VASAVVVGAGVFGSALARELAGSGWKVTLVDRFPPGHARAASGGESRLIRCAHGADRWYTRSARRAFGLWREVEAEAERELLVAAGVLWLARREDGWEVESERALREEGIPVERLEPREAGRLFPSFDPEGLAFCLLEPEAGVLRAKEATVALAVQAQARGARFLGGTARPAGAHVDVDGTMLAADRVVWACGAWLAGLFPDLVRLDVTRQENSFLGAPISWGTPPVPAWIDYDEAFYGLGDLDGRGFKAASDREGAPIDPDSATRLPSPAVERTVRAYVERRFPALRGAPLVGAHVCQYSLTPDTNFLIAPHPEHEGVWILGGGSGHGFKHGPALARYVAALLEGREPADERFGLGPRGERRNLRSAVSVRG
jgi:sarcosine oxidase